MFVTPNFSDSSILISQHFIDMSKNDMSRIPLTGNARAEITEVQCTMTSWTWPIFFSVSFKKKPSGHVQLSLMYSKRQQKKENCSSSAVCSQTWQISSLLLPWCHLTCLWPRLASCRAANSMATRWVFPKNKTVHIHCTRKKLRYFKHFVYA